MTTTTHVQINHAGTTQRGPVYTVTLDGKPLIERSRDPEYAACRALLAKGITGTLVTRWKGAAHDAMRIDIEKGAQLTASESAQQRPRVTKWSPHPATIEDADADSGFPLTRLSNERCLVSLGGEGTPDRSGAVAANARGAIA